MNSFDLLGLVRFSTNSRYIGQPPNERHREDGWQLTVKLGFGWALGLGQYRRGHYFVDLVNRRKPEPWTTERVPTRHAR